MPTPNFNLPLINGASPISIVNDLNSLATAADSAMGTLATSGDIASVRQVANNANTLAQQANTTAEEAKASATTANDGATTAISVANSANGVAIAAKNQADTITATFNDTFNFSLVKSIEQPGNANVFIKALINANKTLFKLYGNVTIKPNNSLSLSAIPGSTLYGYKVDVGGQLYKGSVATVVQTGGLVGWDNATNTFNSTNSSFFIIGTDGNIYICPSDTAAINVGSNSIYKLFYPACIYINANLGDSPSPMPQG